jgi:hypothetical protein
MGEADLILNHPVGVQSVRFAVDQIMMDAKHWSFFSTRVRVAISLTITLALIGGSLFLFLWCRIKFARGTLGPLATILGQLRRREERVSTPPPAGKGTEGDAEGFPTSDNVPKEDVDILSFV